MRRQQQSWDETPGLLGPGPVVLSQFPVATLKSHAVGRLEQRLNERRQLSGQRPDPTHPAPRDDLCACCELEAPELWYLLHENLPGHSFRARFSCP